LQYRKELIPDRAQMDSIREDFIKQVGVRLNCMR